MSDAPVIPVIVGPTAGGKTALGVALACALEKTGLGPGEIVMADAFAVYRSMNIGTAKPTAEQRAGVPHHLIDLVEPSERFSVHDWLRLAEDAVSGCFSRGNTPIVVGGTNLYVKAFCEGLFDGPEPDAALRAQIESIPQPDRRRELAQVDPDAAAKIHPADQRRTIRALEVFRQTGTPISALQKQWDDARSLRPGVLVVGLGWPAEAINARINARVRTMVVDGLVDEVRGLWQADQLGPQAREALGYKQLIAHFEDRCTLDDAIERIKIETRRFAKNQRTWLKRLRAIPGALWLDAGNNPIEDVCERIIREIENRSGV